jgi:hypothetical protein
MVVQTQLLREGNYEMSRRIRKLLAQKGIDTKTIIVATWYNDGGRNFEIILTPDKRGFTFDLSHKIPDGEDEFINWRELTNNLEEHKWRYYKYHAEIAFQVIDEGSVA